MRPLRSAAIITLESRNTRAGGSHGLRFLMISSTSAAKSESIDDDLCPSSHWGHHTGKVAGGFRLRDVDDILRHSRHYAATERPNLTVCAAKSCEE